MRASYRHAVEWIAANDGAGDTVGLGYEAALNDVRFLVTTALVADLFGKADEDVARDVLRRRGFCAPRRTVEAG